MDLFGPLLMIWVRNVSLLAAIALLATPSSLHRLLPMFESHRRVTLNSLHALLRAPPSRARYRAPELRQSAQQPALFLPSYLYAGARCSNI